MSTPTILVTNDDGYDSKGIKALVEVMSELGNVIVVAPDKPQSGMGHAITLTEPIMLEQVDDYGDIPAYKCSGTPADCVKLATDKILKKMPDLCVSGINHGSNASINVLYSGTMSAAMEGAIVGMQAIGFSNSSYDENDDLTEQKKFAKKIAQEVLTNGLPNDTLLNVNFPLLKLGDIKGVKVCRQAKAMWKEDFIEREDPRGGKYFWLTGKFVSRDKGEDTDEWALANSYVSVVPVQFDLTAHNAISYLNTEFNL